MLMVWNMNPVSLAILFQAVVLNTKPKFLSTHIYWNPSDKKLIGNLQSFYAWPIKPLHILMTWWTIMMITAASERQWQFKEEDDSDDEILQAIGCTWATAAAPCNKVWLQLKVSSNCCCWTSAVVPFPPTAVVHKPGGHGGRVECCWCWCRGTGGSGRFRVWKMKILLEVQIIASMK